LFVVFEFAFKVIIPVVIICTCLCTNKKFALSAHSAFMYSA
jgi:hypothetical protein